jgi:phage FluMu gp28-like protein
VSAQISPLDLLLPYQSAWVNDAAKFKIGVQSRQTGKSFQTACESVRDCLTDPGTKWVCLSAGERQALEWLEKCKEWSQAFQLAIENYAEDREVGEALLKQAEIRFGNGSRIIAIPANPSTARGYSANIILDEFAYHEDPDKIWAAMFPSLTNPLAGTFMQRVAALYKGESIDITRDMKIRVVSTFNGMGNKFFDLWDRRKENGYSGHLVTIYDAVEKVCRSTSRSCVPASMIRTRGPRSTSASRPIRATFSCPTI